MIKAAFFDIDNTIYDHRTHRFISSTFEAIKKFQEKGGKAFLCTARCYEITQSFGLFDLGVKWDGYVSFAGGVAFTNWEYVHLSLMSEHSLKTLAKLAKQYGFCLEVLGVKNRYMINQPNEACIEYHKIFVDKTAPVHKYKPGKTTGCLMFAKAEMDPIIHQALPKLKINRYSDYSADLSDDLTRNKGDGIKAILDYWGIQKEEAIAFGDDLPDVPMKEEVGKLVIVGSGNPQAQKDADYVCEDIAEDGIYKTFVKFEMI